MSTTVTYKGNTLTTVNNETKSLLTKGTWLEDDIEITDESSGGSGTALIVDTTDSHGGIIREITTATEVKLQGRKTVTPTSQTQIVTADTGYDGIVEVEVAPSSGGVANVYQDENGVLILDSESTEVDEWKRPLNWMPYADGWDDDDFDGCYFVYDLIDNTSDLEYPLWYCLKVRIYDGSTYGGQYIVDEGYVDNTGNFEIINTKTESSGNSIGAFLPIWDGIKQEERFYVVRITPSTGKKIQFVGFTNLMSSIWQTRYPSGSIGGQSPMLQPCVEIYGRLPYYTSAAYEGKFQNYNLKHAYLLDMTSLTNLREMFRYCYILEKIDGMETWDTSAVTDMCYMFADCRSLTSLSGIEDFDVTNVNTLEYTFANIQKIKILNLGNWVLSLTPTISFLFRGSAFRKIVLPNGLTGKETQSDMFRDCTCLSDIDFNGSKVGLRSYTFDSCYLLNIDTTLSNIVTSLGDAKKNTNMNREFNNNYMLKRIDLRGKDTSSITTMSDFANNCRSLQSVDVTGCDFSAVTNINTNMFYNCYSLVELKGFVYYQSFILTQSTLMPAENLVEVLTNLPTVRSAKTITLGNTNKNKLTAEQIAIATEKGWTVA